MFANFHNSCKYISACAYNCRLFSIAVMLATVFLGSLKALLGEELTVDQELIVACYRVDVFGVMQSLRRGANVNARYGEGPKDALTDPWDGGIHIALARWTAMMALANAPTFPNPPKEFPQVSKDPLQLRTAQNRVTQDELERRRADELTILYVLLSHRASLDDDDGYGSTALHMAVDSNKPSLVRLLLRSGANPNTKRHIYIDGPGNITPLHSACRSKELIEVLLQYGADVSAKDSEGRTPADWVSLDSRRDFDLVTTPEGPRVMPRNGLR